MSKRNQQGRDGGRGGGVILKTTRLLPDGSGVLLTFRGKTHPIERLGRLRALNGPLVGHDSKGDTFDLLEDGMTDETFDFVEEVVRLEEFFCLGDVSKVWKRKKGREGGGERRFVV